MDGEQDSQGVNETALLQAERAFQDGFIAERLPQWMKSATPQQLRLLGEAMGESIALRSDLKRVLARIDALDDFVRSKLQAALRTRYSAQFNLHQWSFIGGHPEPVINAQPVGAHLTKLQYDKHSLLEAAVRNFTVEQTKADGQPRGNRLTSARQGRIKAPSATEFATLCRELDLGSAYQQHLDQVLNGPVTDDKPAWTVPSLLADWSRHAMLLDAYKARYSAGLNEQELALIAKLCAKDQPQDKASPVKPQRLSLLECDLQQIVVIDESPNEGRLLLYVPGDPNGAWSAFSSLRKLANELGRRLRSQAYQTFFRRFVRRRDSHGFYSIVVPAYEDLAIWANISLDESLEPYATPFFPGLANARIEQIKDDAKMIVAPVAELDRALQREHDERLAAEGQALLSAAGLFVPVLGEVLLAVSAWQVLDEVYHGIEAWQDNHTRLAGEHLLNVATALAVAGATTAAVDGVKTLTTRSSVVDNLLPAHLEDGSTKLWDQDITAFRSEAPPSNATSDAAGIFRRGEQAWIEMDGHYYGVRQRTQDGPWQLLPQAGHGPLLRHNGAGAWRLWCEQPARWDDVHYLFRRLGGHFRELDDERIGWVLSFHGLGADDLRGLHVYGRAPDAGLLDSTVRAHLDQRIRDMVKRLRSGQQVEDAFALQGAQRLPGAAQLPDQALAEVVWQARRDLLQDLYEHMPSDESLASTMLRRVFPSLHWRAAQEVVDAATTTDRQRLLDSGRVPLQLAESSRTSVRKLRVTRAYEALYLDTPQNADVAKVAIGMLRHLPGASTGIRLRLLEGTVTGPLLVASEEGATACDLIHVDGKFLVVDPQTNLLGEPRELFDAMATALEGQQAAMDIADPFAHNLRVLLARQAIDRPDEVRDLLSKGQGKGRWLAPLRQDDGRLGYPLSGRLPGNSRSRRGPWMIQVELRRIYPTYTDAQVSAWQVAMQRAGREMAVEIRQLRHELQTLEQSLNTWLAATTALLARSDRRRVMAQLLACWKRVTDDSPQLNPLVTEYRLELNGLRPGTLPPLPTRSFSHVYELAILDMDLGHVPEYFLQAFPNLRILRISGNRLSRLPARLHQLPRLRELNLYDNRIVLDDVQVSELTRCSRLEYLNLSHNPLGRSFSVSGFARLRRLLLRNTFIDVLPTGLLECADLDYADLSDNRISRIPPIFHQAPLWLRHRVLLMGNPLAEDDVQALRVAFQSVRGANTHAAAWSGAAAGPDRDRMLELWHSIEAVEGSGGMMTLLRRLLDTADFQQQPKVLASRVLDMLQNMHEQTDLRAELFTHADDDLTCQDSVALRFTNLEVRMLAIQAKAQAGTEEGATTQALLGLGRRLWRLAQVEHHVFSFLRAQADSGTPLDEVEVMLGYRQALRGSLDLPIAASEMAFPEYAHLDPARVDRIRTQVRAAEQQEALVSWMVDQDFWREHVLVVNRAHFDQCNARHHQQLERLTAQRDALTQRDAQAQGVSAQALQRQVKQIEAKMEQTQTLQKADERYEMRVLTNRALDTAPADASIDVR
ncbi:MULTISPECIES: NEL-type E3 ubiquitin ligase domain-containing protein [Pseudomonas]|uniref:NEL-type E3 ubiquitin ligase domain-containing protein n=1 Tax=Pseudomonas TaxID=286 RepID=UPI00301DCC92